VVPVHPRTEMCLILVARAVRPDAPLILAANRDEFLSRPTAPASWWTDGTGLLAGRDLLRGGTWLAVSRGGKFCAVTNIREPRRHDPSARSRGELPPEFVVVAAGAEAWTARLGERDSRYNGYNLVAGDIRSAWYHSNRDASGPLSLGEGLHGLSNSVLGDPWPKVSRTASRLRESLEGDLSVDAILDVLANDDVAPDDRLPNTGVGLEAERALSAPFVRLPGYGTRASTVVGFGPDGHITFVERTWPPVGGLPETRRFRFRFEPEYHPVSK